MLYQSLSVGVCVSRCVKALFTAADVKKSGGTGMMKDGQHGAWSESLLIFAQWLVASRRRRLPAPLAAVPGTQMVRVTTAPDVSGYTERGRNPERSNTAIKPLI